MLKFYLKNYMLLEIHFSCSLFPDYSWIQYSDQSNVRYMKYTTSITKTVKLLGGDVILLHWDSQIGKLSSQARNIYIHIYICLTCFDNMPCLLICELMGFQDTQTCPNKHCLYHSEKNIRLSARGFPGCPVTCECQLWLWQLPRL